MSAAAVHLTPVTLELGGKCPALLDSLSSSWDREVLTHSFLSHRMEKKSERSFIYLFFLLSGGR